MRHDTPVTYSFLSYRCPSGLPSTTVVRLPSTPPTPVLSWPLYHGDVVSCDGLTQASRYLPPFQARLRRSCLAGEETSPEPYRRRAPEKVPGRGVTWHSKDCRPRPVIHVSCHGVVHDFQDSLTDWLPPVFFLFLRIQGIVLQMSITDFGLFFIVLFVPHF